MDESRSNGRSRKKKTTLNNHLAPVHALDKAGRTQSRAAVKLISIAAFFIHTIQGVRVCVCHSDWAAVLQSN